VRLRIRRDGQRVSAVIFNSNGQETVIEGQPALDEWSQYSTPIVRYDRQRWSQDDILVVKQVNVILLIRIFLAGPHHLKQWRRVNRYI
jgi:hypothetical protein